jgi:hypothetical protein
MGCLRVFIGPILIVAGLYAILAWYGYSTMIDPLLQASDWWAEWARRAFASELLAALILGIGLVASGSLVVIRDLRRGGGTSD